MHASRSNLLLQGLVALHLVVACAAPRAQDAAGHVATAERLVRQVSLDDTGYEHGPGSVVWEGRVSVRTDCSGLIDQLLMHDDGYTPDDFKRWFGSRRPTAARYHDAMAEGRGFARVDRVADIRPGDLIAIKYLTRKDNTGHIMLVAEAPRRLGRLPPVVDGTEQWEVTVIDSSESGHGPTDTRHKRGADGRDHDGLGRGVFRLYALSDGSVEGFAWSTSKASRHVGPEDEHLLVGRLIPGYRP
jgi:hypothetical protein